MPRKANRYAAINAVKNRDWTSITSDSLAGLSLKALRQMEGDAQDNQAPTQTLELIHREIEHAEHDAENQHQ